MKIIFFFCTSLIVTLYTTLLFAGIQSPPIPRNPKNKDQIKRNGCCPVEKQYGDSVVLESVCLEKNRTVFNFRYLLSNTICSYSDRLEMKDSNSNRYRSLGMKGIQECPQLFYAKRGHRFQWYFESLKGTPDSLDITEDLNADLLTPNWRWWHWENVNISQCSVKE